MSPFDLSGTPRPRLDALTGATPPDLLTLACTGLLLLPGLVFAMGWTQPWAAGLAGGAGVLGLALSPGWRAGWPLGRRTTWLCLLAGLAWAGFTGAAHWLYATADWQVRDAVLNDLARFPWPIAYDEEALFLLRAPLGYFLPAALAGSLEGAQVALWVWTGASLALVLGLLAGLGRSLGVPPAVLMTGFALFGGLDLLPNLFLDWNAGAGVLAPWGRGGEWWNRAFQYPGHVTALLWAPNHAIPAWICGLLVLRHGATAGFARGLGLGLAAAAAWSPVAAAGAAVLGGFAVLAAGHGRVALRAPANWLAIAFALPTCLYLVAGSNAVPHGWLFLERADGWWRWPLFLAVEVLPWAVPAWAVLRGRLVLAAGALLCLLPLYIFGAGNEAASRGSQAALAVLAVAGIAALWRAQPGRWRAVLRAVAVLAALGSLMEASLLVAKQPWEASERCTVPEAARQSVFRDVTDWSHYLTPWPDPLLEGWMATPHPRPIPLLSQPCWPDGSV